MDFDKLDSLNTKMCLFQVSETSTSRVFTSFAFKKMLLSCDDDEKFSDTVEILINKLTKNSSPKKFEICAQENSSKDIAEEPEVDGCVDDYDVDGLADEKNFDSYFIAFDNSLEKMVATTNVILQQEREKTIRVCEVYCNNNQNSLFFLAEVFEKLNDEEQERILIMADSCDMLITVSGATNSD